MRKTINPQPNLREPWLELEHARELETISSLLDAHPKLNELVLQDLRSGHPTGRERCWSWGNERGAGSPGVVGEAAESVSPIGSWRFTWQTLEAIGRFASSAS